MKNWKTSLGGLAMILVSLAGMIQHIIDGTPIDFNLHAAEIVGGVGLLFAKDHNVTGT